MITRALFFLLSLGSVPALHGQTAPMSARELHGRIVALIERNAGRPLPAGDTLVTWSPKPNLYSTVRRSAGQVHSSLVRADAMVGTADARWAHDRQDEIEILWTQRDSTLLELVVRRDGEHLVVAGSRSARLPLPTIPWAVADYGMQDQLLPLYESLQEPGDVAIYRPFAAKWDTLQVSTKRIGRETIITEVHADGETWRWLVTADGLLVRITRSRHPGVERRPLPESRRMADYERLSVLADKF